MSLFRTLFHTLDVPLGQRTLEYVDGVLVRELGPGRHRPRPGAEHRTVDVREQVATTAPQDVLTADGVTVRVTAAIRWRVGDPQRFVEVAADPLGSVYLAVQVALRDLVVEAEAEAVVRTARASAGEQLARAARRAGDAVGVEVLTVVVKDVVLPLELRAAAADLAGARTRGRAQLEAARAETAALRSLANGAALLDQHPALARLRLVQALPPGSRIELVQPERAT